MKDKKCYLLSFLIILSALLCSILGNYWNTQYYHKEQNYTPASPPLASAMQGLHDQLFLTDFSGFGTDYAVSNLSIPAESAASSLSRQTDGLSGLSIASIIDETVQNPAAASKASAKSELYSFTTATDDYFSDACFIGDSRTVGISQYAGIEGATFLCRTSLTIYDYDKPKVMYEDRKTSVHDVLAEKQFGKIYLMVGINECGTGTPEYFYEHYRDVVNDIQSLQPDALIFIQANLLVTKLKSDENAGVTNESLLERNKLIATLANQKNIFYIDINESSLCDDGALVADYTWDQVHIKAQYYPLWKDFLLQHAVIIR